MTTHLQRICGHYEDELLEELCRVLDGRSSADLSTILAEHADYTFLATMQNVAELGGRMRRTLHSCEHEDEVIDKVCIALDRLVEQRQSELSSYVARRALVSYQKYLISETRLTFYDEWGPCYSPLAKLLDSFLFVWNELQPSLAYGSVTELLLSKGFDEGDVRDFFDLVSNHDGEECPGFVEEMNVRKAMAARRAKAANAVTECSE